MRVAWVPCAIQAAAVVAASTAAVSGRGPACESHCDAPPCLQVWGGKVPAPPSAMALFTKAAEPVLATSLYALDLKASAAKWKVYASRDLGPAPLAQPPRMWAAMTQLSPGADPLCRPRRRCHSHGPTTEARPPKLNHRSFQLVACCAPSVSGYR